MPEYSVSTLMCLFASNLGWFFRTPAGTRIACASGQKARAGEVTCMVDGVVKRCERIGNWYQYEAKETFLDMLAAEDPFLAAWRRDELHHVSDVAAAV